MHQPITTKNCLPCRWLVGEGRAACVHPHPHPHNLLITKLKFLKITIVRTGGWVGMCRHETMHSAQSQINIFFFLVTLLPLPWRWIIQSSGPLSLYINKRGAANFWSCLKTALQVLCRNKAGCSLQSSWQNSKHLQLLILDLQTPGMLLTVRPLFCAVFWLYLSHWRNFKSSSSRGKEAWLPTWTHSAQQYARLTQNLIFRV